MSKFTHKPADNQPPPGGAQNVQGNAADDRESSTNPQGDVSKARDKPEDAVPGTPEARIAALEAEMAAKELKISELSRDSEAKITELNDQYLRKAADFENYRKRMVREKQEVTDFANQSLLSDLLPVIDDFERAIRSAETSDFQSAKDFVSFFDGVKMIEKQLSTQLENKWGLKRFDSEGEPFDPNRHEAIQMEKSADVTEAVIKEDYLKGYLLKDRVLRFAKVKVLMPEDVKNNEE